MAYNSYYPAYYPQQMNNSFPNQNPQQNNNGIIWVVGENGADSYLVAPGQMVYLWDSTAPVFYVKSADNMGRPSKRTFEYKERGAVVESKQIQPATEFASKDDVDYLKAEISSLRAKFDDMEGGKKK